MTTYDHSPVVAVTASDFDCAQGWAEIRSRLADVPGAVIAIDVYPGADLTSIERELVPALRPEFVVRTEDALLSAAELEHKFGDALGSDPVFAMMQPWVLQDWFSEDLLNRQREQVGGARGRVVVIGPGATLVAPGAETLVYADMARWEIQRRQREHRVGNLGMGNADAPASVLYKRAFFADWRAADRHKAALLKRIDFLLDTNSAAEPKLISGELFRRGLEAVVRRPFRVVPFFDPGPWGGQWMKEAFVLPEGTPNYAWGFDCVPEENSLLLGYGWRHVEVPALDAVLYRPEALLGKAVYTAFGAEFPIRFDFLDTMEGGNLSLQVHPLREYIREQFGMSYTQDESYYMLEAADDAVVYLGLWEGVDRAAMERDLRRAQADPDAPFPAERYVNVWPARKHDHFLIPAGTVHCSGRNGVVLEISATPYIFTFKLWDWGRLGMDGRPRPIHLDHGLRNVQWERTTEWVGSNLVGQVREVGRGEGFREEQTGLHALEFIETRRHWFTGPVLHDTAGTVNVLNLVQGDSAIVESPTGAFAPMLVHYAETFIVPAAVGQYVVRPAGDGKQELATLKAYVREQALV